MRATSLGQLKRAPDTGFKGSSSSRLFVLPITEGWDLESSLQNISTGQWYLVSFPHQPKYRLVFFKFFPFVGVLKSVLCAAICDFVINVGIQNIRLCNSHSLENTAKRMFVVDLRIKKKSSQQCWHIVANNEKFFSSGRGRGLLPLSLSKWWRKNSILKQKVKILDSPSFFSPN